MPGLQRNWLMQRQTVTWLPSKQDLQAAPGKTLLPSTHLELAPFKEPRLKTSVFFNSMDLRSGSWETLRPFLFSPWTKLHTVKRLILVLGVYQRTSWIYTLKSTTRTQSQESFQLESKEQGTNAIGTDLQHPAVSPYYNCPPVRCGFDSSILPTIAMMSMESCVPWAFQETYRAGEPPNW